MDKLNTTAKECQEMAQSINRRVVFMRELNSETEYSFQPPTEDVLQHTVLIKRAILGKDVEPTELCMLEVETKTDTGTVETFPLAYLRGTDMLQVRLDFVLSETAKIKLAKGKGPVYIIGEYAQEWKDEEAADESDGEVEVEPDSEEEDIIEDAAAENKENTVIKSNGVAAAVALAADRKRKLHDDDEVSEAKKPKRVSKGNDETEAMDEAAEKTVA